MTRAGAGGGTEEPASDQPPGGHGAAEDLGAFIRSQREVARMSVRRLAELAGVSNPYLSQIERGLRRPSADILQQLAEALRISVETLYVRAGLLRSDEHERPEVVDAIERDPALTPDQKSALLNVYLSFVATTATPPDGQESRPTR